MLGLKIPLVFFALLAAPTYGSNTDVCTGESCPDEKTTDENSFLQSDLKALNKLEGNASISTIEQLKDVIQVVKKKQRAVEVLKDSKQEKADAKAIKHEETLTEAKLGTKRTPTAEAKAIQNNGYCKNRLDAYDGSNGGVPGTDYASLQACAVAVYEDSRCGYEFSYSTVTKACDCVAPGSTCEWKAYSAAWGFSTYQVFGKIQNNGYCKNRLDAYHGSNGGVPGTYYASLQACAVAVYEDSRCGYGFSYSTGSKVCDCVEPGATCEWKHYPGAGFSTYDLKLLPKPAPTPAPTPKPTPKPTTTESYSYSPSPSPGIGDMDTSTDWR